MKLKKKIILLIVAFVALLASGIGVYAYISQSAGTRTATGEATMTNSVQEVSSFYDLVRYSTASNYNDSKEVRVSTGRKVLKLTSNITLTSNLVITEDIQIDLNGKTLDLNDYSLTFSHGYTGAFGIYNGNVDIKDNGKVIVDLIHSGFISDVNYKSKGIDILDTAAVTILNVDEKYSAYQALYLVGNVLNSSLNDMPKKEDYLAVSDSEFTLTIDKFLPSIDCEISNSTENCTYIYHDIDLPTHYLSSDISITYSSTNNAVIHPSGDVHITDNSTDVILTATVSKTGWNNTYSIPFTCHAVDLTHTETKNKVANSLIKSYIKPYYKNESLVVLEEVLFNDYYYGFDHAIDLPKSALDGTITYSYSVTNYTGGAVTGRIANKNTVYFFEPNSDCFHLVVNGTSYNMYSTYVSTKESLAYLILNHLYGGAIIYDKTYSSLQLDTVATINAGTNSTVKNLIAECGVTAINYAVKTGTNANTYYRITNNVLSIQNNVVPPDKIDFVTVTFTFSDGETVDIDVYVDYLDSSGSILSSFLTYYNIYDPIVPSDLLSTFDMPFAYNDSATATPHLIAPYIVYDVATYTENTLELADHTQMKYYSVTYNKPINLNIQLYYNGAVRYTFNAYSATPTSLSNQLDAYLSTNNLTLAQIGAYSDAKYIFSINAQESLTTNQNLILIYNYKFNTGDAEWTQYSNTISNTSYLTDLNTTPFTILGGLFYNTQGKTASNVSVDHAVKDETFFKWIYNKFKPTSIAALGNTFDASNTIIPVDWLSQDVLISRTDTALSSVGDFSGIKYLKNVSTVDLSGDTVSDSVILGLAGMPSLTTLTLKSCGITDISALSGLTTVKVLDISNNSIEYFDALANVTCLEKVYLYGNNADHKYYGSSGICNFQAFADLMRNGCAIYNTVSNDIPILYAESNNLDDYRRLKSIAYQDKLKLGLDITKLYEGYYNLPKRITTVSGNNRPGSNSFGLQTAGNLNWGYEAGKTAGTATYFWCTLTYDSGYVLTVKYYVERY